MNPVVFVLELWRNFENVSSTPMSYFLMIRGSVSERGKSAISPDKWSARNTKGIYLKFDWSGTCSTGCSFSFSYSQSGSGRYCIDESWIVQREIPGNIRIMRRILKNLEVLPNLTDILDRWVDIVFRAHELKLNNLSSKVSLRV